MIVRRLARPLIAAVFIKGGVDTLRNPAPRVAMATPLLEKVSPQLPEQAPSEPGELVRIDAAVKIGAGALFALGRLPRTSALLLAASLVPTTVVGHPFWEKTDPGEKAADQLQFVKNLSILGGLMLAAVDTEGKPSLGWRGRRAARKISTRAGELTDFSGSDTDVSDSLRRSANTAGAAVRDGVDIAIGRFAA